MGSPGDPRVAGDTRGLQWRREMQKAARERPERCGGGERLHGEGRLGGYKQPCHPTGPCLCSPSPTTGHLGMYYP